MSTINRSNPYRSGDIVSAVNRAGNGAGEGVLWRVTKVQSVWVWIKPVYSVTGPSVLRPKKVQYHELSLFGMVELGLAFQEFHELIQNHFRTKSGLTVVPPGHPDDAA